MPHLAHGLCVALLVVVAAPIFAAQSSDSGLPPVASAGFSRASTPMTIDGQLNEPAWLSAPPLTRFFEVYPGDVGAPRYRTEVRLLFDELNLYIAVRAFDPHPEEIRSSLTRRDQVLADQDYVELLLDPLGTGRRATLLRTNADGIQTDGEYSDETGARNYLPDFSFDVRTQIDAQGWTAEFRVPLSTIRYRPGSYPWTFVVFRNVPRTHTTLLATVPVPRASNCVLCYAEPISGPSLTSASPALSVVPYVAYTRREESQQLKGGLDAQWHARPNTSVDITIAPDFSQVEADALQLVANTRLALAVTEKRPFFLEGADLLSTPLPALYTRSWAEPAAGARITGRDSTSDYTALLVRDKGGGTMIEPGAIQSSAIPEPGASTSYVGRYRLLTDHATIGGLASVRAYDDGSQNVVAGIDARWTPRPSDRITTQLLWSSTSKQTRLRGTAAYVSWRHSTDDWYSFTTVKRISHDFRTWNGFVPQVGVNTASVTAGLYFYPSAPHVTRVSPLIAVSEESEIGAQRITRTLSPGFSVETSHDTVFTLSWSPRAQQVTPVGLRSYSAWTASLSSTPFSWMPDAYVEVTAGEAVDVNSGRVGRGTTLEAEIPLRLLEHFEITPALGYQSLRGSFVERNVRLDALWHFSSRLYAQLRLQRSRLESNDDMPGATVDRHRDSSFLLNYHATWQTQYFVGVRSSGSGSRELFAKLSHAF